MGNMLCVAEVATLGGVTTNAVRKAIRSGKLPASGGGYQSNGGGNPYTITEEDALDYFRVKSTPKPPIQPKATPPIKPQRDAVIKCGIDAWYSGGYNVVTPKGKFPDPRGFWVVAGSDGFLRPCRVGEELKEGETPTEIHFRRGGLHWEYRRIRTDSKGRRILIEPTYNYNTEEG